jgi:ABC-type multidrug transport system fused ATPase/permease subunit
MIQSILFSKENITDTVYALISSTIAALLEGVSYGMIVLAFTAMTGNHSLLPQILQNTLYIKGASNEMLLIFALFSAVMTQGCRGLCIFFSSFYFARITEKGMGLVLRACQHKILEKNYNSIRHYKIGHLTDLISSIPVFFPHFMYLFNQMISHSLLIIVALAILVCFSTSLLFIVLGIFACAGAFQKILIKKIGGLSIKAAEGGSKQTALSSQILNQLKQIHLFNFQDQIKKKMNNLIQSNGLIHKKIHSSHGLVTALNDVIAIIAICCSIAAGYFIFNKEQSDHALVLLLSFLPISLRLCMRMVAFMNCFSQMLVYKGKFSSIIEFLEEPDINAQQEKVVDVPYFTKQILLNNLCFQYPNKINRIIKNLDLRIEKNKLTAFVGPSGSGKTTIIDLLLKFHLPSEGDIFIDGHNLNTLCTHSWRQLIGVVPQESSLFHETIAYNIRMGNPDASMEEIKRAAKQADAHEFIMLLEDGYQTIVGESAVSLSGGEQQRIALARALVRRPVLLILDEATSNLDNESQRSIQQTLQALRISTTIIIIAHRLSTITNADMIHVIENGSVTESGSHTDLINLNGRYAALWEAQNNAPCISKRAY